MNEVIAGLDWSGTPDAPQGSDGSDAPEVYAAATVTFYQARSEVVDAFCASVSEKHGMGQRDELHAIRLTGRPTVLTDLLDFIAENGNVYALVWDKQMLAGEDGIFADPASLTAAAALATLETALNAAPLQQLWCDEELHSKTAQQKFDARLHRLQRERWGETQRGPKVKHRDSTKSNLIQLADAAVYLLRRYGRGLPLDSELSKRTRKLWQVETVRWGKVDDLRPYLP